MTDSTRSRPQFGSCLRDWRQRRRYSQLALALEANVSARHISFLEGGRARPSRTMVQNLAECLDMPFEARNALLAAAGFAPVYARTPLESEHLEPIRQTLTRMMHAHAPSPALIFDARWRVLDANPTGALLMGGDWQVGTCLIDRLVDDPALRAPIRNWPEVAAVMTNRLRSESRQAGGDSHLDALAERLAPHAARPAELPTDQPILTLRYATPLGDLTLFTTEAELSSAQDLTLRDLRLEIFFPANRQSRELLDQLGSGPHEP
ncbi:helix-turn-helix transcriptional regulator [Maricaulis sp.]|uniref:helix-turn-helix domain-containing protein n=1 Tax=Maricaulis sp. TaxID=1486257 RepID=UPI002B26A69A|nr:helix-turn-helix transcriptional regulator [Maricaulis sp.]